MDPAIDIADHTTFGYQQARRNSIRGADLEPDGNLDIRLWPPLFIYDVLQLPGALVNALGIPSTLHVIPYMTPSKMRGSILHRKTDTGDLWLQQTNDQEKYVRGMMLFGRGKTNRAKLGEHYGSGYRRMRANFEVRFEDKGLTVVEAYVWIMKRHVWERSRPDLDLPIWEAKDYLLGMAEESQVSDSDASLGTGSQQSDSSSGSMEE